MTTALSIVVPVLDESGGIAATLRALAPLRARGAEVIVVDGGSRDDTAALARPLADRVVDGPRGRARQMNAGAALTNSPCLLFLHADTRLPEGADAAIAGALATHAQAWGRFDVIIEGRSRMLPLIAALMNRRSRWSGIATGDQAMFMTRAAFDAAGGFPDQPLMEDIELSIRLRRMRRPICLRERVITSGRRWEQRGVWRTIVLMWRLRLLYALGVGADRLARWYR
ncbi:TIGR04283 family arsenosugar biosynthesis glycosyltransferase [uncultured Piscinibacter sp.]|uniref:TIGR04283 family arsenosugar biosynthesis glycosyltransferase n=1 Tax=uncultured Piscinibacter sp. TaxID=1131835 RepID=UPI002630A307|nr:TIGR04283 family arsenosugar biosynthesis glycosyltransferase [uncultured Piscinibacter sp.]